MDRNAYMTYLETQLERLTSACMTVQGYGERMDQMSSQITSVEERIVNLTRLIKLLQTTSETQEQESQKIRDNFGLVNGRLCELDRRMADTERGQVLQRIVRRKVRGAT